MLLWSAMRTHPSLLPFVGFQPVKCYMEGGRRLVIDVKGVLFIFYVHLVLGCVSMREEGLKPIQCI